MSIRKALYIPIEIFDRELGGALLLASEAVSRGWLVVVGGKIAVFGNMTRFKDSPGVFFLKSVVPGEVFKQNELMKDGHRVVSLDVEGLNPSMGEAGVRLRYSAESIDLADLLFFWGSDHYDYVRAVYPQAETKAVVSGSPIIDEILARRERAGRSRGASGRRKILIGTSCGSANHINGFEFARQMIRDASARNVDPVAARALERDALLDQKMFDFWKEAVPRIGETFKDCEVVLRPHPSEDKEFWKAHLKPHSNIRIDDGGSILEEMLDSDVYLHFNSTSALTSAALGIPTLMPLPRATQSFEDRITYVRQFCVTPVSTEEMIGMIREFLAHPERARTNADLSRYCRNLSGDGVTASPLIMDALEARYSFLPGTPAVAGREFRETAIVALKKVKFFLLWLGGVVISAFGVEPRRPFLPRGAYRNARAKQPPTPLHSVVRLLGELIGADAAERIRVEERAGNLFVFSRRSR